MGKMQTVLEYLKKQKKFLVIFCMTLFILLLGGGIYVYKLIRIGEDFSDKFYGIDKLPKIEQRYKNEPNLRDCFHLADMYGYVLKDYSEGIRYAEQCLELDEKPIAFEQLNFRIHFILADFYHKIKDIEKAKKHLTTALNLDSKNFIEKYNWIEEHKLQTIYNKIPNKP